MQEAEGRHSRLEEEKATLDGMVESRDELLLDITRETGLDRMGEDEDDEEEEEDADDGGDATAPPTAAPPHPVPPTIVPEEINEEGPVEAILEQEASMPHEVVLADAESKMPQLCLHHPLMRDYEVDLLRMDDDFDDLDDGPNEGRSDMDKWLPDDGSNDRD
jgi:hypothetical protein